MTMIYGLIFLAGLFTGGVWAWLATTGHYERIAAERAEEELEMAEFQELYAAWAMLHRNRSTADREHRVTPGSPMTGR